MPYMPCIVDELPPLRLLIAAPRGFCAGVDRAILTRPRKAGEADAAIDPLSDPGVRAAVASATFEQLVGFQLTEDQLKYNATR